MLYDALRLCNTLPDKMLLEKGKLGILDMHTEYFDKEINMSGHLSSRIIRFKDMMKYPPMIEVLTALGKANVLRDAVHCTYDKSDLVKKGLYFIPRYLQQYTDNHDVYECTVVGT